MKEQLDATRDGLRKLFGTRNNVQSIKDEMETVDKMDKLLTAIDGLTTEIQALRTHTTIEGSVAIAQWKGKGRAN